MSTKRRRGYLAEITKTGRKEQRRGQRVSFEDFGIFNHENLLTQCFQQRCESEEPCSGFRSPVIRVFSALKVFMNT